MSTQIHSHESQATLRMRRSKDSGAAQGAQTRLAVVWYEELVRGCGLETLRPVPGHVLNHE